MSHPLFDLSGRVALVTGAGGSLGSAMAAGFAEAGADLMLCDINPVTVQATAQQIAELGRRAAPVVCDVSDPEQIRAMFQKLDREYGKIDILGNVAGPAVLKDPEMISMDEIMLTFRGIAIGRLICCQEAGRRMLAAGKGSIISIGSICSVTANGRGHIAYSMAMGAVVQMTRELSTEWSGRGVRVNAILPAQITNPSLEERMSADPQLRGNFLRGIPMGRMGRAEEIKGVAIFLASDAASFVTGALIPFDGGNLAKNAGGTHPGMPLLNV
jgi:NAD(P)-dependent dehydrogenase (short-subunit alcohol dehydrogenase family)